MREQHLETIRKACIAANPEIEKRISGVMIYDTPFISKHIPATIHLSDVLLTIEVADLPMSVQVRLTPGILKSDIGNFEIFYRMGDGEIIGADWNLYKDDLTDQSDECLAFLASLTS